ncbi:MAG: polyprenyl synthetase family protein [Ignavibacteriae bacterium]|nr:polyprenyl synthetase family protein [Ignavibacteriota bacterium]NOG98326.1 polyprenyl synthetase family protein [Ignavibacteriota bacterium]
MNLSHGDKYYQNIYAKEVKKIETKLSQLLKGRKPKSLYDPCEYIITGGGKRLRPFIVLLACKAVGAKFSDAYNAAIGVEVLHNFTLVHDDIMDNAKIRRGRPTTHIKFDTNTAILAGDNLIAEAYHSLLKDCKDNDKLVLDTFTKGITEICEGQSYDKDFENQQKVTIDEYKTMILKKTAVMVQMCCSIGAQIGKGTKKEVRALENYGRNLGMAFQIQDDLLDIFGDEKEFGKTVGGDLIEGKKTFLFLKAFEKAKGKDLAELKKVITNSGVRKNQIKKYRDLYISLGVIDETEKEVEKYTKYALRSLKNINDSESKEMLIWLANTLIKRSK